MVADYPTAYEGQPGFEFIQEVPTWWDETRVLAAEIGKVLVTARRTRRTWYVGGMSAGEARTLQVPLSFLGKGHYDIRVWRDAPDAGADPNHLTVETLPRSEPDMLDIHFVADGGFAARIAPAGL